MRQVIGSITALGLAVGLGLSGTTYAADVMKGGAMKKHHTLLLKSAVESADFTEVTLPIHEGRRNGETVWYVVTESSKKEDAERRRVHYAPKLANAKGSGAVEKAKVTDGIVEFLGSVDFSPERIVMPGPTGFPPAEAKPGAIGEPLYTPLIELPDGTVINAPHIKNKSGEHDRLIRVDLSKRTATFKTTKGFFEGRTVYYTTFNASDPGVSAIEAGNYTPRLALTPDKGSNTPNSALTGLAPIVNGPTGKANPQRQGLSSALMGEGDPLNIVEEIPADARALLYSPMWDVHASVWAQTAMPVKSDVQQRDFRDVARLALAGQITGPDGHPWGPIGVVVNCPIISIDQ